ncbi:MAG TPA: hypothetical protein VF053_05545 [Streptosporangiales bacterium]
MTEPGSGSPADGAWPFLLTRGWSVGERMVLAPSFLQGREHTLRRAASGPADRPGREESGELQHGEIRDDARGSYRVAFRRIAAAVAFPEVREDPALAGKPRHRRELYDSHGRQIEVVEGVVLTGRAQLPRDAQVAAFQAAHEMTAKAFRDFYVADDSRATTVYTGPLETGPVRPTVRPHAPRATGSRSRPTRVQEHEERRRPDHGGREPR